MYFLRKDITKAFNKTADTYHQSAFLAHNICNRLHQRLDVMKIQPQNILDLGSGIGNGIIDLQQRYPQADIFSLDIAIDLLKQQKNSNKVCGDAKQLPFPNASVDLVISNLMLPWANAPENIFHEIKRILKPEGLLLFSTFGPDTLKELRFSWARVDDNPHVHLFYDLHDIGDALLKAGFSDPVMDAEILTIHYKDAKQSLRELKQAGMYNILSDRKKSVTGKNLFAKFMTEYETFRLPNGALPNTYEVTYGHAWKVMKQERNNANEIVVPISSIQRR